MKEKTISNKKTTLIRAMIIVALILILVPLILVATMHPVTKMVVEIMVTRNFEAKVIVSKIPLIGKMRVNISMDGNVLYIPGNVLLGESYIEIADEKAYIYVQDSSGNWIREEMSESDMSEEDKEKLLEDIKGLFDWHNYDTVTKGQYKQKDSVEFNNFENSAITISEGEYAIELELKTEEGNIPIRVVISNLGGAELTLPEV